MTSGLSNPLTGRDRPQPVMREGRPQARVELQSSRSGCKGLAGDAPLQAFNVARSDKFVPAMPNSRQVPLT